MSALANRPLISVCMITYNHANFIVQAIDSVLMQEGNFELELIIADDSSTDKTEHIINSYLEKIDNSSSVKYFRHKTNKGMMPNFIWALNQCQGDYIALCDGDDYWVDSQKLKKQVDFLKQNLDYCLCFHPCKFLQKDNITLKNQNFDNINYEYTIGNMLMNWAIPTASMVFRRTDVFDNFPSWFTQAASGDIPLVVFHYEVGKFSLLQDYMSVYRQHDNGISEYHKGSRMVHYRTFIHLKINEFFDYKYEEEIYNALIYIIKKFMPDTLREKQIQKPSFLRKLKSKLF